MAELTKYQAALPHLQRCFDELKQAQATLGWVDDNNINEFLRRASASLEGAIEFMKRQMPRE